MFKDWLFYPLALIITLGLIGYELTRPQDSDFVLSDICQNGYAFKGEDLKYLVASPGTTTQYMQARHYRPAHALLTSHVARAEATPSGGVFAPIGYDYKKLFRGKPLKLTITARGGQRNPLEAFDAGYFSSAGGQSGWKSFKLSDQFQDYHFTFTLGQGAPSQDSDFFGIWPGVSGKQETMEVSSMHIQVLSGCGHN